MPANSGKEMKPISRWDSERANVRGGGETSRKNWLFIYRKKTCATAEKLKDFALGRAGVTGHEFKNKKKGGTWHTGQRRTGENKAQDLKNFLELRPGRTPSRSAADTKRIRTKAKEGEGTWNVVSRVRHDSGRKKLVKRQDVCTGRRD